MLERLKLYRLSKGQICALLISAMLAVLALVLGVNLRKVQQIRIGFKGINPLELLESGKSTLTVYVDNPTCFPFVVQSCDLFVTVNGKPVSRITNIQKTRIKPLGVTDLPLNMYLDIDLRDLGKALSTEFRVEGAVTARVFRFTKKITIKEKYALSTLFRPNGQ